MYNMEIYCTSLYCIENPYWTRRADLVNANNELKTAK